MKRIHSMVLATHNIDKRKELKAVLGNLAVNILTLDDFPQIGEIEESGNSLLENSMIKAKTVHNLTGLPAIADDTGLEVDALDGAPGIFSARYAGENATYDDNISKLLEELKEIPPAARTAVFRTIVSFVDTDRELWTEGAIKGMIIDEAHGKNGFGYDPVFFIPGLDKTFAELSAEEKNKISHRGLALKKIRKLLAEEIIH